MWTGGSADVDQLGHQFCSASIVITTERTRLS